MLSALSIRNIVLIEKLDLQFETGLCVLTGETGAGKSILLDSLAMALGGRADSALLRSGEDRGSISAEFHLKNDHPVFELLEDIDFADGEPIILRRTVSSDGRSRALINDQAVSAGLLRRVGERLVEIHGQNAERGLLDARSHRKVLDLFARLTGMVKSVQADFLQMKETAEKVLLAEEKILRAREDEDYIRHVLKELEDLAPEKGEEEQLSEHRSELMHAEKILDALKDAQKALNDHGGVENKIRSAVRAVERVVEKAAGKLDPVLEGLERASIEMAEAVGTIDNVGHEIDVDPAGLEHVEERLFALRAAARKHKCEVDKLPDLLNEFKSRLNTVEQGDLELLKLREEAREARNAYVSSSKLLSDKRSANALKLDKAVMKELAPLKLGNAIFQTKLHQLEEAHWSDEGIDKVEFLIATNPGSAAGPLMKVASGGELSRFMLALKVVLAQSGSAPTLIFDEVDRGVGGATADAVGDRLARLATDLQVLVVTHSPQVAAAGEAHWNIRKSDNGKTTITSVNRLSEEDRNEEIARMLSGASITNEARAAALSLREGN